MCKTANYLTIWGNGRKKSSSALPADTALLFPGKRALFFHVVSALALMPLLSFGQVPGYSLKTVAGGGAYNFGNNGDGGPATSAILSNPQGIALDASGNIYICEAESGGYGRIRKVTTAGKISTVAGGGAIGAFVGDGGPATSATLSTPMAVAFDAAGNMYIADSGDGRVRKVSTSGTITTVAGPGSTSGAIGDGGPATSASFNNMMGLAVDASGVLYVADTYNNRVRKITLDGTINTVAGTGSSSALANGSIGDGGPATSAILASPTAVALDTAGNLYIADYGHNLIRMVTPAGIISTVAGNGNRAFSGDGGLATIAALAGPTDVKVDSTGNLVISDNLNAMVRLVTSGVIFDIAGYGTANKIWYPGEIGPGGVAFGSAGEIFVACDGVLYSLTPTGTTVSVPPSIATASDGYTVFGASSFGAFLDLTPSGWTEIYGSYLASTSRAWQPSDFNGSNAPTSLDGVSVSIGGQPAFLSYVSPGQINAQVPSGIGTGEQPLVITTKYGTSMTYAVTVNPTEPGLLAPASFCLPYSSTSSYCPYQYAAALFSDGVTFVLPPGSISGVSSRRATSGDTITLYGVGFGLVTPNVPAGEITPSGNSLTLPLEVFVGGVQANVTYAGLAPGSVGLYQINLVIPKITVGGNPPTPVSLTFTLGGLNSGQNLYLALQ
jgi:uncharacterized protein (TIGR03437 family)